MGFEGADVIKIINEKFDEYNFYLINRGISGFKFSYENTGRDIPIIKFNIHDLFLNIKKGSRYDDEVIRQIRDKLIDVKMTYSFLRNSFSQFYQGMTVIVGNQEIEKLNPNTMSLLQRNHYAVYLVSVLYEQILSALQLIYLGELKDYKKNKWDKIHDSLTGYDIDKIITPEEHDELKEFKEKYRTSELHNFSAVRGFLSKDKWDHFQDEENILRRILERLFSEWMPSSNG